MITPESSEHTTGRIEHSNTEEVEEIDFKHNIMKILEDIKQDVTGFLCIYWIFGIQSVWMLTFLDLE